MTTSAAAVNNTQIDTNNTQQHKNTPNTAKMLRPTAAQNLRRLRNSGRFLNLNQTRHLEVSRCVASPAHERNLLQSSSEQATKNLLLFDAIFHANHNSFYYCITSSKMMRVAMILAFVSLCFFTCGGNAYFFPSEIIFGLSSAVAVIYNSTF